MNVLKLLLEKIDYKKERMIQIRRYLHQYPEVSFQEEKTAKFIEEFYKDVPVDKLETNFGGQRGIIVTIKGTKNSEQKHSSDHNHNKGKTILLRSDFDALPVTEQTGLSYSSKNPGCMHACGHDAHTAYMLILAESLAEIKDLLSGEIRILHQPAEETPPGGALAMINAGCLEGVDLVFGIHLRADIKTGHIICHPDSTQSGQSMFKLVIQGRGGHGASPHLSNDPIVAGAGFVTNLQTIVSRRVNPFDMAVITVGSFDGAGQFNIIKDSVTLDGDVRTMNEETRILIEQEFRRLVAGLEETFNVKTQLDYTNNYPVLKNDPEITLQVKEICERASGLSVNPANQEEILIPEITKVETGIPWSASEDFARYLQQRPGCYFYVGAMPEDGIWHPHHSSRFQIDERSMTISAKSMAAIVCEFCG